MGESYIYKRNILLIIFIIFILILSLSIVTLEKAQIIKSNNISNHNTKSSSHHSNNINRNVTINLKSNNISYGHELLWTAHTTGTNYEESAVTYIDGIAYIGSCSTHGEGYDMLFAVNTSNGNIIWSEYTGPGYVGPVIDKNVV